MSSLNISEKFFSCQGEGVTSGVPSYFIRLKGCNLSCGLDSRDLKNIKPGEIIETGNLVKEGKATWACDSASIWLFGKKTKFEDIIEDWNKLNISDWVKTGRVHIIWTGGEPSLLKHQKDIIDFINYCNYCNSMTEESYNEVETNGTQILTKEFLDVINQINCSVKLQNSGMSKARRIVPDALESILKHPGYWFKFVISKESDLKEIEDDFIKPFNINPNRVVLMPGLCDRENFHEKTRFSLEMAKKYGYIGLTRLHISAWSKTTGV